MTAILESKYQSKLHVASVIPIIDKIKNLHVITCDICDTRQAEYDVYIDGVIEEIPVLKRCCDNCLDLI
jgi:transcription elongation factor Elf1